MLLYVPSDYDLRSNLYSYILENGIVTTEAYAKRYLELHLDKYHYILHFIHFRTVTNKNRKIKYPFIEISSSDFQDLIGQRYYYHALNFFIENEILETDGIFIHIDNKSKCLGFRLTETFRNSFNYHSTMMVLSENFQKNLRNKNLKNQDKLDNITKWINKQLQEIRIKENDAYELVRKANNKAIISLQKELKTRDIDTTIGYFHVNDLPVFRLIHDIKDEAILNEIESIKDSFDSRVASITNIANQEFFCVRDNAGKRVHTNLTNLAKELRQFLYVNQRDYCLVSIDVSNSQPFALVGLIKEHHQKGNKLYSHSTIKYIEAVASGTFYKLMKDALNIMEDDSDFKTRLFARVYYDKNENCYNTLEFQKFLELFPDVAQIIMMEKQQNYKDLSVRMQAIESSVIIDSVLGALRKKYHDLFFFSHIHDSIVCPIEFSQEVTQLIKTHYKESVGISPSIKDPERLDQGNTKSLTSLADKAKTEAMELKINPSPDRLSGWLDVPSEKPVVKAQVDYSKLSREELRNLLGL